MKTPIHQIISDINQEKIILIINNLFQVYNSKFIYICLLFRTSECIFVSNNDDKIRITTAEIGLEYFILADEEKNLRIYDIKKWELKHTM